MLPLGLIWLVFETGTELNSHKVKISDFSYTLLFLFKNHRREPLILVAVEIL